MEIILVQLRTVTLVDNLYFRFNAISKSFACDSMYSSRNFKFGCTDPSQKFGEK